MEESKTDRFFTWRGYAFSYKLHGHQLKLSWLPLNEAFKPTINNQEEMTDCTEDEAPSHSLSFGKDKELVVCASGFCFDPGLLINVPVIVLAASKTKYKNPPQETSSACHLIGVKPQNVSITSSTVASRERFELVIIRTFQMDRKSLKNIAKACIVEDCVRVGGFFDLIMLRTDSHSLTLHTKYRAITHSLLPTEETTKLQSCKILDVFFSLTMHKTFVLVSLEDDKGKKRCKCVKLSGFCDKSSAAMPTSTSFKASCCTNPEEDVNFVPVECLFNLDFSDVISSVKIISINKGENESRPFTSNVIATTVSGYAVRFLCGKMVSCVNILTTLVDDAVVLVESEWSGVCTKIINLQWGSREKTALNVKSCCLLLDWDKEQVCRIWHSVQFISKCAKVMGGIPHLVMVLNPTDNCDEDAHISSLSGDNVLIVDCFTDTDNSNKADDSSHKEQQGPGVSSLPPPFAMHALLEQNKKYMRAINNVQTELEAKENFLAKTWQTLQDLTIDGGGAESRLNTGGLPFTVPLVSLVKGPLSALEDAANDDERLNQGLRKSSYADSANPRHLLSAQHKLPCHVRAVGHHWKRTVGSLLVVGSLVKNISDRPISSAHIYLVPTQPDSGSMAECVSWSTHWSGNITDEDLTTHSAVLSPSSETTLMCWLDTASMLSPGDIRLHLCVSYVYGVPSQAMSVSSTCTDSRVYRCSKSRTIQVFCEEISLTLQDQVDGNLSVEHIFSLGKGGSADIQQADILALECIQTSTSLTVTSRVSSVRSLESKLTTHKHFQQIPEHLVGGGSKQFIFVADHSLRLCRVKLMEQRNKWNRRIQLFTRTDNQAALMLKLLLSILPDDVTATPDVASSSVTLMAACDILQTQIHDQVQELTSGLTRADPQKEQTLEDEEIHDDKQHPVSPTFHSKTSGRPKSKVSNPSTLAVGESKLSVEEKAKRCNRTREMILKAKRKMEEKLALDKT